jgi:hypothetical protein
VRVCVCDLTSLFTPCPARTPLGQPPSPPAVALPTTTTTLFFFFLSFFPSPSAQADCGSCTNTYTEGYGPKRTNTHRLCICADKFA